MTLSVLVCSDAMENIFSRNDSIRQYPAFAPPRDREWEAEGTPDLNILWKVPH